MLAALANFILGSVGIGLSMSVDLPSKAMLIGFGIIFILIGFMNLAAHIVSEQKKEGK